MPTWQGLDPVKRLTEIEQGLNPKVEVVREAQTPAETETGNIRRQAVPHVDRSVNSVRPSMRAATTRGGPRPAEHVGDPGLFTGINRREGRRGLKKLFITLFCLGCLLALRPLLRDLLDQIGQYFDLFYFLGNLWLVVVFQIPCIYVHELGHVFFGLLVGIRPVLVRIGRQRPVVEAKIAGVWFLQAMDFSGGVTLFGKIPKSFYRLRLAVAMLGGVLAHVIVLLLIVSARPHLLGILGGSGIQPASAFFFANVLLIGFTVIPRRLAGFGDKPWSDALSLLALRKLKASDLEEYEATAHRVLAHHKMERGEYAEAESILRPVLMAGLGNPVAVACDLSVILIGMGRLRDAVQVLMDHRAEKGSPLYYVRLNNLIWALLCIGTEEALQELKTALDEAGEVDVGRDMIMGGTLGCALVELGRIGDGLKLLETRVINAQGKIRKRTSPLWLVYLAYAYKLQGMEHELETLKNALSHRRSKLPPDQEVVFHRVRARLVRDE